MVVADRKEGRMWGGPWYKPPYFEVPEFGMSGSTLEGIRLRKLHEGIRGGGGGEESHPSPLLLTRFIRLTRYLTHIISVPCTFS